MINILIPAKMMTDCLSQIDFSTKASLNTEHISELVHNQVKVLTMLLSYRNCVYLLRAKHCRRSNICESNLILHQGSRISINFHLVQHCSFRQKNDCPFFKEIGGMEDLQNTGICCFLGIEKCRKLSVSENLTNAIDCQCDWIDIKMLKQCHTLLYTVCRVWNSALFHQC